MATSKSSTKKTTKATTEKTKKTSVVEPVVDKEKENLKAQIAEMKKQMEDMMKMTTVVNSASIVPTKERNIRFVSLVNGCLMLKGTNFWEINGRFNSRSFLEREARIIVNNMPELISSGYVYIADPKFVEENDLGAIYANLLSDDDLKNLFKKKPDEVIDIYKNANDVQKEIIISMIYENLHNNVKIDNNILVELSRLSGKDLLHEE